LIQQTETAKRQILRLLEYYLDIDRERAAELLIDAVRAAYRRIEASPDAGRRAPTPYPDIAHWHYLWIKEHCYWFGYTVTNPPIVTNIVYDRSVMPGQIADLDDVVPSDW
jgi:plasmid stabilization system protein ParE